MTERVPFLALSPGPDAPRVREAIDRVLARGWFVLGPELEAFEEEFAAASGAGYAVGVGNGTDAIALTLRALGIGPGDEVITAAMSAAFTGLAVQMAGATPVFVDVEDDRATIDPTAVEAAVTSRTAAVLPVHLYGQPADMTPLLTIASRHRLAVVEDACQAHLATSDGRPVGTMGAAGAFSFYPTKNLGALGDGGAVVTNDPSLARRLRRLRNGGQTDRYTHVEPGVNSRLDELQAAILRARLPFLAGWTRERRALAMRYRVALAETAVRVPGEHDPGHVYHLFTVRTPDRERFIGHLAERGIGALVHYPIPLTAQGAFTGGATPTAGHSPPAAGRLAAEVVSLPLHPGLPEEAIERVAAAVSAWQPERRHIAST
jgi:dTDP-3-amino-3,4,6-trideoxy-alpha-D-glucose transaminase